MEEQSDAVECGRSGGLAPQIEELLGELAARGQQVDYSYLPVPVKRSELAVWRPRCSDC